MKINIMIMRLLYVILRGKFISSKVVILYDEGFLEYKIVESES